MSKGNPAPQPFLKRLYIYQRERFPILVHVPLIIAFSFSAIGYSMACRHMKGFISLPDFLACIFTNITLFFLLRVSDEHKDRLDDALYRSYLPVPRGLITLKELSTLAWILFVLAAVLNMAAYTTLLPLYILMMGYLLLMRYEFFVAKWLKKRQVLYIISHMMIIPLADIYASSYDWKLHRAAAPAGLLFFFGVSFLNGVTLETGRKMRVKETEEEGVISYTRLWGTRGAAWIWLTLLTGNFILARIAESYAHNDSMAYGVLTIMYSLSAFPAILFLIKPTKSKTKFIELMSLVWAVTMYLTLGGIPLILQLIGARH